MAAEDITLSIQAMSRDKQVEIGQLPIKKIVSWLVITRLVEGIFNVGLWGETEETSFSVVAVRVRISPQTHIHITGAPPMTEFKQNGNDLGQGMYYEFRAAA